MIGIMHGPMNEPNLNGTLPVMLCGGVGLNFNSDLQIPYRFPITKATHASDICDNACWEVECDMDVVLAAQRAQNAAAGYAADYQCKRSASSFNKCKEFKKGHHALAERERGRPVSYIGFRHAIRLLSDLYGKGVVRSAQESANLRAYADPRDVTSAESIKTAKTAMMPGAEAVRLVETYHVEEDGGADEKGADGITLEADRRNRRRPRIVSKNPAFLYGMRPLDSKLAPEMRYLSLYEFFRYWRIEQAA